MTKKVGILGVPLGFGAGQTGSELGVNAMRLTRFRGQSLAEHIRHLGYEVIDHGDAADRQPDESTGHRQPEASRRNARLEREYHREAHRDARQR